MKILLTGASSFTGYWFAKTLSEAGHDVLAPLRADRRDYADGLRGERVRAVGRVAELVDEAPFGSDRFLSLLRGGDVDILCHHAAQVGDYRDPAFDVGGALEANTHRLKDVLEAGSSLSGVVLTGSVFEQDEGEGQGTRRAFSSYGLSKGLTWQVFRYWCETRDLPLGKFVIPNPFGPYEEPRFGSYLVKCIRAGRPIEVRTPNYVRDNIHVSLLAATYVAYVQDVADRKAAGSLRPSGYVETQGAFASRFAREVGARLGNEVPVLEARQTDFSEPLIRFNTDPAARMIASWREAEAWDGIAAFYADRP